MAAQLLPPGALFTAGNQIVDGNGNPVRIASLGWSGANSRFAVPDGLDAAPYQTLINQVKAIGFNCLRIDICDMSIINDDSPAVGMVNGALNPAMVGLTCLGVLDLIVDYCDTIGMRLILDSHTNEGSNAINFGANQPNGLWYDLDGASDGTDEGGNTGNVTDAGFLAMWQTIATHYQYSPSILGYDLRNEPNVGGSTGATGSTWGDGSNQDLRAMYQRVGNAILAIDPRPLIICEGPQHYGATFATGVIGGINYGTGNTFDGNSGDLTGVLTQPVVLTTPNKVVYSVHEYPFETSGNLIDQGGQRKINAMTAVWGWVVKNNIAPVFIGEMGSFFNGSAAQIAQSTTWANMMTAYCNGTAAGGPVFSGAQQGIHTDWWVLSVDQSPGSVPDFGILTAWTGGSARTNQLTFYNQLFYTGSLGAPSGAGPVVPSPNGTSVTTVGPAITDANGNLWTITSGAQVAVNGVTDSTTASVVQLAYISGLVWKRTALLWQSKSTPTDTWLPVGGSATTPFGAAPVPSPNGTIVTTVGPAITDANGNLWTITSGAQVAVNGVTDSTTASIVQLALVGAVLWSKTAGALWQSKTTPGTVWAPVGGTSVSPLGTGSGLGPTATTWNIHNGIALWIPSSSVLMGARRANNGVAYQCVRSGTTATSGGPAGTGGAIVDGTAWWRFLSTVDFTDRSGAFAALPATFTNNLTLQFWNNASQTTQAAVPFFGLTGLTMGAFSLTVTAAPSDSIRTFLNSQSQPLAASSAGGVAFLQPLAAVGAAINYATVATGPVTFDGVQFIDPCATSGSTILSLTTGAAGVTFRNCIFDGTSQAGGAAMVDVAATAGTILFTNCLFIDRQVAAGAVPTVQLAVTSGTVVFINCTFIAVNAVTTGAIDNATANTTTVQNCGFFGYGTAGYLGCTFTNSATSAANFGSGTNVSANLFNVVAASQFINPATDFRLTALSTLIGAGAVALTNLPAADDISGLPRNQGANWDIGCWEQQSYCTAEIRTPPNKFW
jgi:hypothetical protein